MHYHHFKPLNTKISKLGFGGASLSGDGKGYGFGEIGDKKAHSLVEKAIESGVNIFDTAPIYGFNKSEKRLGEYLRKHRDNILICNKSGITWHDNGRVNLTNDPKTTESMLHSSLKNMQTDYFDIYLIHWPDSRVDIRKPMEILTRAKEVGKIRSIGLSNTNLEDLAKAQEIDAIDILQGECNLFNNSFEPFIDFDIFKMGWGSLDKGILAGTVTLDSKFDTHDARNWAPWWKKSNWKEKVKAVNSLKATLEYQISHISIQYSQQNVECSLCGVKNNEHLVSSIKSIETIINKEYLEFIQSRLDLND